MEDDINPKEQQTEAPDPAVEVGVRFLRALFAEEDTILFRPIETWVEQGRKRSRVGYGQTCYRKATANSLRLVVSQLLKLAEVERFNLFFGVCPRIGNNRQ